MTPEQWQSVKQLFQSTVELPPQQREDFLRQACTGDPSMLAEVQSLLNAHEHVGSFLDKPIAEHLAPVDAARSAQTRTCDPDAARPVMMELSKLISDYEFIRPCGEGAFGQVWIVKDRAGAFRAMKIIRLGSNPQHRELQALEHFCRNVPSHPNLLSIFHIGQVGELLYYTMELADDLGSRLPVRQTLPDAYQPMTLRDLLEQGRLHTDTAVEITLRLLKGLQSIHHAGLVHRDIKPANVLFVNREVKLADISLMSESQTHMSLVGTPHYMPPDDQMDATADTYAIAKILYEMITGRNLTDFPHLPKDETISSQHLDLGKLNDFLIRACAPNAKDRFAAAAPMQKALLDCRFLLVDAPLLELANEELKKPEDTDAVAAIRQAMDEHTTNPTSKRSRTRSQGTTDPSTAVVMDLLDRFVKIVPWLVLLIIALVLIHRLI